MKTNMTEKEKKQNDGTQLSSEDASKILKNVFGANNVAENITPLDELENRSRKNIILNRAVRYSLIGVVCLLAIFAVAVLVVETVNYYGRVSEPTQTVKVEAPSISSAYESDGYIYIELINGTNNIDFNTVSVKNRESDRNISVKCEPEQSRISIPYVPENAVYEILIRDTESHLFMMSITVDMGD